MKFSLTGFVAPFASVFLLISYSHADANVGANVGAYADDGWYSKWLDEVTSIQAEQPHWVTPLSTVTPRLEQEFRSDFTGQQMRSNHNLDIFGMGKGLELIPFRPVEIIINVPPYLEHNDPKIRDGFGDLSFLIKYRILSANDKDGDYILTAFMGLSLPTGTATNGFTTSVFTPTIAGGKGFGAVDVQSTFGVSIPANQGSLPGHNLYWNTALQYHFPEFHVWPEIEDNYTHYAGGTRNGNTQNFVTPALMFGRFTFHERTGFTFGGGYQIATSSFNNYNHAWIVSLRLPF